MPFNGSGGFVPLAAPIFPAVPNTTIVSSYYNQNLLDIMAGLGNAVTRDGQSPATGNLPMGGFKHTGAGGATGSGEYIAWGQTGPVSLGGNLSVAGTLAVTGLSTLSGGLTLTGNLNIAGRITATFAGSALESLSGAAGSYGSVSIGRTASEAVLAVVGGVNQVLNGDAAGDLVFRNNSGRILWGFGSTLNMTLSTAGELGIGVAPIAGSRLTAHTGTNRNVAIIDQNSIATIVGLTDAGSQTALKIGGNTLTLNGTGSAGATHVLIDSSGNVGIGGVPSFPLDISSSNAGIRVIPGTTTSNALIRMTNGGGTVFIGNDSSAGGVTGVAYASMIFNNGAIPVIFGTNGTERMRVTPTGDVGIGVPAPTTKLDIFGEYGLIRNGSYSLYWGTGALVGGGGTQGCIRSNGDLLFGVNASEVARFTATTFALATATGSFFIGGQRTLSSGAFTLAINAAFNAGHGNSRAPDHMKVWLVCVTAEAGYAVGQRVEWIPNRTGFTGGYTAYADAANLNAYVFNATVQLPNAITGVATNITPANWQIRLTGIWL